MFEIAGLEGILVVARGLEDRVGRALDLRGFDLVERAWFRILGGVRGGKMAGRYDSNAFGEDEVNPFSVSNANAISAYPRLPFRLRSLYLYPFPVADGCEEQPTCRRSHLEQ